MKHAVSTQLFRLQQHFENGLFQLNSKAEIATIVNNTSYNMVDIRPTELFDMGDYLNILLVFV